MTPAFTVDHLLYIVSRRHRRQVHAMYRRWGRKRGVISEVRILHEAAGCCGERQPWPETAAAIVAALAGNGDRVAWIFLEVDAA